MPLSPPSERELIHRRSLDMSVHRRGDGEYDVEGHLVDVKPFPYQLADGRVGADEPVHDMWIRITVDARGLVRDAEAVMDVGPHGICHLVTPNFKRLRGLTVGAGWNRRVRERLGGTRGCTHLVEMLSQIATTALQALYAEEEEAHRRAGREPPLDPKVLNACFTYHESSSYVREHFPAHYRPPHPEDDNDFSA